MSAIKSIFQDVSITANPLTANDAQFDRSVNQISPLNPASSKCVWVYVVLRDARYRFGFVLKVYGIVDQFEWLLSWKIVDRAYLSAEFS